MPTKLLFVYNASSSFWNKKIDFAHKILSPKTYNCDLCKLTHTSLYEKERWKKFRETSNMDMKFLYKNNFQKQYPDIDGDFPAIFIQKNKELQLLIGNKELASLDCDEHLVERIYWKLKND